MRYTALVLLALVTSASAGEVTIYSGPTLGWHKTYQCDSKNCEFMREEGPTNNTLPTQPYTIHVEHGRIVEPLPEGRHEH